MNLNEETLDLQTESILILHLDAYRQPEVQQIASFMRLREIVDGTLYGYLTTADNTR